MKTRILRLAILALLTLSACDSGTPQASPSPAVPQPTAVAPALPTNTAAPLPTATPVPPTNTAAPLPTATLVPPTAQAAAPTVPPAERVFGPITFAAAVINDKTPVDVLEVFPEGITLVYAVFDYKKVQPNTVFRTEWLVDGVVQEDATHEEPWKGNTSGTWWNSISRKGGLEAGDWQLNVYLDGKLQQSGKFKIGGTEEPHFGAIVFAPEQANDEPMNPASPNKPILPNGTTKVYAFIPGVGIPQGSQWSSQWFLDGAPLTDPKDRTWDFGSNQTNWISCCADEKPFQPGTYQLKLMIGKRLAGLGTFIVAPK